MNRKFPAVKNAWIVMFYVLVIAFLAVISPVSQVFSASAQYTLEVQPGVSQTMIDDTELSIETTSQFCTDAFGFSLVQPVAVLLVTDQAAYQAELQRVFHIDELAAARWAKTTDAVSGSHKMIRNGSSATSDSDRIFLVSHEMVHQYQQQIGYPTEGVWLIEGMADAIGIHMTEKLGRRSVATYKEKWQELLAQAKGKQGVPTLALLSTRQGWSEALQTYGTQVTYRTAALTVLQLWDDYGLDKVIAFYRLSVTKGASAAFEMVFGYPLRDFELKVTPVASVQAAFSIPIKDRMMVA